ncbi:MAG: dihydrodipicolinate synthase family protein [Candidatus Bathyarchaeia archaeon]
MIVCGSTSEFASLSIDEHKKVVEVAVDHVNGRVPVIAGTGACSTRQVIDLTRHAKDVGADGAIIVPPFYTKPKENELYEHYRRIAESVDLPIKRILMPDYRIRRRQSFYRQLN